jgi:uncharacterized protein
MTRVILLALMGFAGGAFGSMVGLGGGIFIIPGLVLFLKVPVHSAIGASLLGVVATSTTSAAAYLKQDLSNVKLGMTLETMTVGGALAGGIVGATLSKTVLSAIFGAVMICVSVYMGVRQRVVKPPPVAHEDIGLLGDSYEDSATGEVVSYRVHRLPTGLGASLVAGVVSGLLGVGGGFMKVPVMVVSMKVPVRAAVATSSMMIGVTACTSAAVYFTEGLVDPTVTVPVVLGVVAGAYLGSKLSLRVKSSVLTVVLAVVLFALAVQMLLSSMGISVR